MTSSFLYAIAHREEFFFFLCLIKNSVSFLLSAIIYLVSLCGKGKSSPWAIEDK